MIQQLTRLLPRELGSVAMLLGIAGAVIGVILWLGGSRFNRTVMTLISVSTGGIVGLQVPGWFGLPLEGWATAVLGALVLGITGFVLNKVWVGLGLGAVLATWAALGTFALGQSGTLTGPTDTPVAIARTATTNAPGESKPWAWPAVTAQSTPRSYANDLWGSLSEPVRRVLPFACCLALVGGVAASVLWPRVGVVLLYSCTGLSLIVGLGITVVTAAQPQWLRFIPPRTSSQIMILAAATAFGAVAQWRCVPAPRRTAPVQAG